MHFSAEQFTESTLVDCVRGQLNELPKPAPENVNNRSALLRRLFRFYFHQDMPHAPFLIQRAWYRRSPLGYGRGRIATAPADLKLKVPQRAIVPLSVEQVARFWRSFRALQLEDLLFSEAQMRVHGKGSRVRMLPLPPETIRILQCYLKTERPLIDAAVVAERLSGAVRVLDLYRQQNPTADHKALQLLLRRIVRVRSRFQKLVANSKIEK